MSNVSNFFVARDLHCKCIYYPSPTRSVCEDTLVDVCVSVLVIPSTCIRGRDIVIAP